MGHVAVLTDTVAGMPDELAREHDIAVIPLHVHFGTEAYRDGVDMSVEEFYRRLKQDEHLPTTSAPSVGEFQEFYRRLADEGAEAIICIPYSGELGMGYGAALTAAQEMPELGVRVVNPHTALMAQGFLALEAARAARAGATVQKALERVEALIPRVHVFITVDTLEYLWRGGRIGRAQALMAGALQIKPLLHIPTDMGTIEPLGRSRTRPRALDDLVEHMAQVVQGRPVHVAVQHGAARPEEVALVTNEVRQRFDCREVYESTVSPVAGTHLGPGTLALAFYADEE